MNNIKNLSVFIKISLALILLPNWAWAASLYGVGPENSVGSGDTFIVRVFVDTEGKSLNVVEGSIGISGASVSEISLGGSVMSLWPVSPEVKNSSIVFTGGAVGGFNQTNALLFSIALTAQTPGEVEVKPQGVTAYENDGKGTALKPVLKTTIIKVKTAASGSTKNNEWQALVSEDKTPPADFTITLGQDSTVYQGKKFLSFETTDAGSGVDFYEVIEGNDPGVRSTSPYILKDQTGRSKVTVRAYDKAGNIKTAVWTPSVSGNFKIILIGIIILIFSAILYIVYIRRRRKNTKN